MSKRKSSRRHSLPQKLVLVVNCLLVSACFAGAAVLVFGQGLVGSQKKVELVTNRLVHPCVSLKWPPLGAGAGGVSQGLL